MSSIWERQTAAPGCLTNRSRGHFVDEGTTVPAAGTVGYAPGSLFMLTSSSGVPNIGWYINNGTRASSLFQLFIPATGITPITAGAAITITAASHAGRTILLPASTTVTMAGASGSGARYRFIVNVVSTAASFTTAGSSPTSAFKGSLALSTPASTWATANIGETFATATATQINLNGTAAGGASIGDYIELEDIASGVYQVQGWLTTTTTPSTPFA